MSFADKKEEIDQLYEEGKYPEEFALLDECFKAEAENLDLLWRLCRSYYDLYEAETDAAKKTELLNKGAALVDSSLKIDGGDECSALHKWKAIYTSETSKALGTKERIGKAFVIKDEAVRAHELDPTDATPLFLLGNWCYEVAGIGWMTRKVAAALFAEPPTATYEESLEYHLKSHELNPKFKRNLACIVKVYEQLGKKDKAKEFAKLAAEIPSLSPADKEIDANIKKYL